MATMQNDNPLSAGDALNPPNPPAKPCRSAAKTCSTANIKLGSLDLDNPSDIESVLQIEHDSFPMPWSGEYFRKAVTQKYAGCIIAYRISEAKDTILGCMRQSKKIVGYCVLQIAPGQAAVILSIAVDESMRRQGVATLMLNRVRESLDAKSRIGRVEALVRESNLPAQLFFKSCDFKATNTLSRPFGDCEEDGYEFILRVPKPAAVLADKVGF